MLQIVPALSAHGMPKKQTHGCQGRGSGMDRELVLVDINYYISDKILLYSAGHYVQSLGIEHDERYMRKRIYIYMCVCVYIHIYACCVAEVDTTL